MAGRTHRPSPMSGENDAPRERTETTPWFEHASCALIGLGTVAAVVFFFGQSLLAMTQGFAEFATTVLVFSLVTLWVLVWITVESVWEWRAGRLTI